LRPIWKEVGMAAIIHFDFQAKSADCLPQCGTMYGL
jgi:hypothetical protein